MLVCKYLTCCWIPSRNSTRSKFIIYKISITTTLFNPFFTTRNTVIHGVVVLWSTRNSGLSHGNSYCLRSNDSTTSILSNLFISRGYNSTQREIIILRFFSKIPESTCSSYTQCTVASIRRVVTKYRTIANDFLCFCIRNFKCS